MSRLPAFLLATLVLFSGSAWAFGGPCGSGAGACACCCGEEGAGPSEAPDGPAWEDTCCCVKAPARDEAPPAHPDAVAPSGGPELPDPTLEAWGFLSPLPTVPTVARTDRRGVPRPPPVPYPILFGAFLA